VNNRKIVYIITLILTFIFAACSGDVQNADDASTPAADEIGRKIAVSGGEYTLITAKELKSLMDKEDVLLVNVHIPFEGDITGTDTSFPFNEVEQNLDNLPEDKSEKFVLYCSSDRMSTIASEELVGLGYTNVMNLEGGFRSWIKEGYSFESP
jgi:rhodanese-related sulfurtransferase